MTKRDSFIFYRSFFEATLPLSVEDKAGLFEAITCYALDNDTPNNLSPIAKAMFSLIKPQLDANHKRYENGKKGAKHGSKGGRPGKDKPQNNPLGDNGENPKITPNVNVNPNVNGNDNKNVIIKESPKPIAKRNSYSPEFEKFWELYPPNGGSKIKSFEAWNKITEGLDYELIYSRTTDYRNYLGRTGYDSAHAATWLNQQRWTVNYAGLGNNRRDIEQNGRGYQGSARPDTVGDQANALIAKVLAGSTGNNLGTMPEIASAGDKDTPVLLENSPPLWKES